MAPATKELCTTARLCILFCRASASMGPFNGPWSSNRPLFAPGGMAADTTRDKTHVGSGQNRSFRQMFDRLSCGESAAHWSPRDDVAVLSPGKQSLRCLSRTLETTQRSGGQLANPSRRADALFPSRRDSCLADAECQRSACRNACLLRMTSRRFLRPPPSAQTSTCMPAGERRALSHEQELLPLLSSKGRLPVPPAQWDLPAMCLCHEVGLHPERPGKILNRASDASRTVCWEGP